MAHRLKAAVYTRKSTEHGLDQEFNSLVAQREAGEAYVQSQRSEGWVLVEQAYDDGGLSGATMERPALQRLLTDVDAGRVDVIVVYKVDRLTRSLPDFALIIKRLDVASASFVSVTQQFNTSSSMGRLTLNVLLSFAQFEREVTAERIRDKVAASKKKGIWMGGVVPFGYKNVDKKLIIDPQEAKAVKAIYAEYEKVQNVHDLRDQIAALGFRTRGHSDEQLTGCFSCSTLLYILKKPIYIGEMLHKGDSYCGCHDAIIDGCLWDQVQAKLEQNRVGRRLQKNFANPSLLAGLLKTASGKRLTPSHTNKKGRRYRYYITKSADRSQAVERFPAGPLENAARHLLIDWLQKGVSPSKPLYRGAGKAAGDRTGLTIRLGFIGSLESGSPHEQKAAVQSLVNQVILDETDLIVSVRAGSVRGLLSGAGQNDKLSDIIELTGSITRHPQLNDRKCFSAGAMQKRSQPDDRLINFIARAHLWSNDLRSGQFKTITELAAYHGVDKADFGKQVRLVYLAPDIISAIV